MKWNNKENRGNYSSCCEGASQQNIMKLENK